ncbi:MAG: T9SS type A sorting domain-containing protein [Chitinophagaceae bacterium]
MKQIYLSAILLLITAYSSIAQINYNANDPAHVLPYTSDFLYGSNMGYYPPWTNQTIADIAAGNSSKGVKGAGIKTLHQPLPEAFLEQWGYDINLNDFRYYNSLGIKDNTVFLETPSEAHRDKSTFGGCGDQSLIWSNIYTPIWDNGENGTPVNDDNYLALYIYKTVTLHKQYVKFWELVNEPDQDGGNIGWRNPGDPAGNWWDRNPTPCELYNLKAPIYSYIRMLHIAYEVIKTIDPTAYVSMGGVGYPSFLDALLRNTENPVDGFVTAAYPYKGGAWIDCLSFHYYPIYEINGKRHSDACLDGFLNRKHLLDSVLQARGYDGITYPKKVFINTENNMPRVSAGGYFGSDEIQRNYDMKALVGSQLNGISQFYVFSIGDSKNDGDATDNPFDFVGLYKNLNGIGPTTANPSYRQQYNPSGLAYKTMSDALSGFSVDQSRTTAMNLPAGVRGGAFKNTIGDYKYVLWATTATDASEVANATYSFPGSISMPAQINQINWDYAQTNSASMVSPQNIALTGVPVILLAPMIVTALTPDTVRNNPADYFSFAIYPNPVRDRLTIKLHLAQRQAVSISITNAMGQMIMKPADNTFYDKGDNIFSIPLSSKMAAGIYYCHMKFGGNREQTVKFVVSK